MRRVSLSLVLCMLASTLAVSLHAGAPIAVSDVSVTIPQADASVLVP